MCHFLCAVAFTLQCVRVANRRKMSLVASLSEARLTKGSFDTSWQPWDKSEELRYAQMIKGQECDKIE